MVLNATITQPHESHRAICLFIHGSGPQDRDATMGVNKPFKDLAMGLAVHGISSIRYDKRTYTYQNDIKEISPLKKKSLMMFPISSNVLLVTPNSKEKMSI